MKLLFPTSWLPSFPAREAIREHSSGVTVPDGWRELDGALEREFRFRDFAEALAFVDRVARLAEAENHHPDIALHWNRVTLRWWTHVRNAITDRDAELAERTNELV
ncbi:MAG: 4a-hydroxytetrahydrobiopterin dehydratase [Actinomycetota bacterium]|nr:4a-hydroxytetrahydrobiopterin dehydratase [Actinomycetota bacterium]